MRAISRLMATIAVAAFVACGAPSESDSPRGGSDGASPDTPVTSTPEPSGSNQRSPRYRLVVPQPGMDGARPIRWQSVRSVDARTLMIRFTSGVEPCYVLDHVEAEYGRKHVAITLFEGHDPQAENVACIELAELKRVRVELAEPIGNRRVVDGAR